MPFFLAFTRPWLPPNVFGDRNVHLEDFDGLYGFILRCCKFIKKNFNDKGQPPKLMTDLTREKLD